MKLVTPDLVSDACITVLEDYQHFHLAPFEAERGLAARTIEPLKTIDVLAGEGFRLRQDRPPAALLGVFGTSSAPENTKNGLTFVWTLAVEVTVVGTDRRDVLKRRDWYTMLVAECLLQRLPRIAAPVDVLELADVQLVNGADEGRQSVVAEGRLLFDVTVRQSLEPRAPYDVTLPPGSPGGPPEDPYDPPVALPAVASATTTISKEQP